MAKYLERSSILFDAFLILVSVSAMIVSLFILRISISISLMLLVGAWVLDLYIKKSFEYDNRTVFADLCFASFIFSSSNAVTLSLYSINTDPDNIQLVRVGIFTALIFMLWIGNISLCRGLLINSKNNDEQEMNKIIIYAFSIVFAIMSTALALLPQLWS